MAPFIPHDLVERAQRVLHPWSGATPDERRRARQLLREYERQRTNARTTAPDAFRSG